ncbi:hypothetical protein GCM10022255_077100 [Dactylosporangium darangshiense]|uniref:Uncharacterized protein n=1 Tax=Dactylosporangium darangshiense TaxID=579108 RepID=A0ABP8DK42_9ACTN
MGNNAPQQRGSQALQGRQPQADGQHQAGQAERELRRQPGQVAPRRGVGDEGAGAAKDALLDRQIRAGHGRAGALGVGETAQEPGGGAEQDDAQAAQQARRGRHREERQQERCGQADGRAGQQPAEILHGSNLGNRAGRSRRGGPPIDPGASTPMGPGALAVFPAAAARRG